MNPRKILNKKRVRRVARTRAKVFGTASKPRLSVSRSNRHIYAQLIDDEQGHTILSASAQEIKTKKPKKEVGTLVGEMIGKKATEKGIASAVFDRREYKYHGRIKALAEGARKAGLKF